jgi:hypothetical protein
LTSDPSAAGPFTPGTSIDAPPIGDVERQAVASLRGYAYQVAAATLAWLDLSDDGKLFLEVAEDYATVAQQSLLAPSVPTALLDRSSEVRSASDWSLPTSPSLIAVSWNTRPTTFHESGHSSIRRGTCAHGPRSTNCRQDSARGFIEQSVEFVCRDASNFAKARQ